jgi:ParB/RepB/Spo0J family partition protein
LHDLIANFKLLLIYEIIAGERRWRAAKIAGLTTVPVIVREINDQGLELTTLQLINA